MNLINNNPFRILDLPVTANEREITKQIHKLETYVAMGKTKSYDSDFPFLSPIDRTSQTIEDAKKLIEKSESKFHYSFFWFWSNNSADELAFDILKGGNTSKAISIWEKSVFALSDKIYEPIILFDNLINESSSWSLLDNEDHSLSRNEGAYTIERKKTSGASIPVVFVDLNVNDDWIIECDTKWLDGVDNVSYGIIYGKDRECYFSFNLSGNGYYCCGKNTVSTYDNLIAWKKCDLIVKSFTNHIKIEKIESIVNFYINNANQELESS